MVCDPIRALLFPPGPDALEQVQLDVDEELLDADFPAHTGLGFGKGKRCLSELGEPSVYMHRMKAVAAFHHMSLSMHTWSHACGSLLDESLSMHTLSHACGSLLDESLSSSMHTWSYVCGSLVDEAGQRDRKRVCCVCTGSSSHSWAATLSEEENDPGEMDNVPHMKPSIFSTRAQVKRAQKKREKLLRRAALGRAGDAPQPPAAAADAPTAMLVETNLHFGGFERHTTGTLCSQCLL